MIQSTPTKLTDEARNLTNSSPEVLDLHVDYFYKGTIIVTSSRMIGYSAIL